MTTATRRKKPPAPPPLPAIPDDLAGYTWESHPNDTQEIRLVAGDDWSTKWYFKPERAIAEARRRLLSQPRQVADEAPMGWIATCAQCGQSFIHDRPITEGDKLHCTSCRPLTYGPDAQGVFRRRQNGPERVMADPKALVDGRWQPRKAMDETKLQELTASVAENGVLEDLIAIINEVGFYELITGHRRKQAAIRAGLDQVPVRVVEKTAAQARALAIISNDDREDLNDVERGQAYEQIIADEGISEAELSRRLGRPRSYIQQRRQVASAALEIAEALAKGEISFTQARGICTGAGGDVEAQRHALEKVQTDTKVYGRTTSEADARGYAEKHLRSRNEAALKALGWQIASFYGNKMHTFVYGGSERPAEWTPAQMIQVVQGQRQPAGEPPAAREVTDAERATLRQRDWDIHTNGFDGWIIAKVGGKPKVLHPDELPPLIADAQRDLDALKDRFNAQSWRLHWERGSITWRAKSAQGREEHDYSYRDAEQLIKQIEAGKIEAAPPPTKEHCPQCSAGLRDFDDWTWHNQRKLCKKCHGVAVAAEADERAAMRAGLPIEWLTTVPDDILYYLAQDHQYTDRVLFGRRESDEKIALALDKLSRQQIEETLLSAIVWSKWEQRSTPRDYRPDEEEEEIAVGEEGEI